MSKLLTIKNFILKTPNYLFKVIMKILFFPFKLIGRFLYVIISEFFSITFRDVVKFLLVSFIATIGFDLFKAILYFSGIWIGSVINVALR